MIKVIKTNNKTTIFKNLEIGTLFYDAADDTHNDIYQKTIPVFDKNYPDDSELNSVVVWGDETGNIITFNDCDEVIPINDATIRIEE